jgi:hypothetical protein
MSDYVPNMTYAALSFAMLPQCAKHDCRHQRFLPELLFLTKDEMTAVQKPAQAGFCTDWCFTLS